MIRLLHFTCVAAICLTASAQDAARQPAGPGKSTREEGQTKAPIPSARLTPDPVCADAAPKHEFGMPIAAANSDVQQAVLRGMAHLLTFWDEAAYQEFKYALAMDPDCAMAHWGMVVSRITPHDERAAEKEASLNKLQDILARESAPENELAYIRALYSLLKNGPRTAADDFHAISKKWKSDEIAPLFAAMLCRDGFDADGRPREGQREALRILDSYLARHPENQPAYFLRALIEETNPVITLDMLEHALKAVELSPDHAPAHHLLGHLYFRSGQYGQAEEHFDKAAALYDKWQEESHLTRADNEGYFRSLIYRASSECCRGDAVKAMETARKLAGIPIDTTRPKAKGTLIQEWEVRNLPLKIALNGNVPISHKSIEKLVPGQLATKDNPLSPIATPVFLEYASMLLAKADNNISTVNIHKGNLDRLRAMIAGANDRADVETSLSYWVRALELCDQYIMAGSAIAYASTAEIWYNNAIEGQRFSSMLLPPVLLYPVEWKKALWLFDNGKYEESLSYCEQALKRFPEHAAVLETRRQILEKLGKAPAAGKTQTTPVSASENKAAPLKNKRS